MNCAVLINACRHVSVERGRGEGQFDHKVDVAEGPGKRRKDDSQNKLVMIAHERMDF